MPEPCPVVGMPGQPDDTTGENMIEIIVYNIKEDRLDAFRTLKPQLIKEALTIPGIVSSKTHSSDSSENQFVDVMEWESKEAMENGFEVFKKLPSSGEFMGIIAGQPVFAGKFATATGA